MSATPIFLVAALLIAILIVLRAVRIISTVACVCLVVIVGLIGFLVGTKVSQFKTMMGQKWSVPPEPVTTAVVQETVWHPTLYSVGTMTPVQGVTVTAQLDGNVARIAFTPGTKVKAGDLLVQQDITTETAEIEAAKAALQLARINLDRSRELLANHTISQQQYDSDEAAYKQAAAQVANIQSVIDKKTIRAPFAGRLGIRLVNLGQTLKAGDPIVSLQSLDPIYADFYLPQQDLPLIAEGTPVHITCDALRGRAFDGRITAINPDVDSATRSVRTEATLANAEERLHPGMFVNVEVILPASQKSEVIPSTSVLYAPYGDSVFVVEDRTDGAGHAEKVVRQQFVRLGEKRGDFVAVLSGLKSGETVVTTGAFKLRNGISVKIDNSLAPDAELNPKPSDS